ncbi:MAG: hypothetical protein JXA54_02080 [Candidatus Heimdallarchaeota archaeon]|nr:hypothetical protein [Candidatus Heimdallarchaeota archaeon]
MASRKKTDEANFKDYIEKEPEFIVYMNLEQAKIVDSYMPIILALRKKPMTVKEIHNLYLDKENQKHTFTIKTIYRYLEKLETAGLVQVAGHRVTEGSRVLEKLYSRTGKIFFLKPDESYLEHKKEYRKKISTNLMTIMKEYYNKPDLSETDFSEVLTTFMELEHKQIDDIISFISKNVTLIDLYSKIDIDQINVLNNYSAILFLLISKPEIIQELRKLLL